MILHKFDASTAKGRNEAAAHWTKPDRRSGLARVVNGIIYIFDRASDAIGHPTTVATYSNNYKPTNLQG